MTAPAAYHTGTSPTWYALVCMWATSPGATWVTTPVLALTQAPGGSHVTFWARPGPMPIWRVAGRGLREGG
jgi:hypothetical protein